jgi:hypothetical protein
MKEGGEIHEEGEDQGAREELDKMLGIDHRSKQGGKKK